MTRQPKNKKITCQLLSYFYKPAGIPLKTIDTVHIKKEEFEAFRLKDFCELEQKQAAEYMEISQSTFHRLLKAAKKKIIDALVNGKAIKIENRGDKMNKKSTYKIAVCAKGPSKKDDIDDTFARANYFQIYTVEDKQIIKEEPLPNDKQNQRGGTGIDVAKMLMEKDVQYVICKNIGPRVSDVFEQFNIEVFTRSGPVQKALDVFLNNQEV